MEVFDPTIIYYNNIKLVKHHVFHVRRKHIEVHYHFVHKRVLCGEVELLYVPTDQQVADIFTKPLGLDKLPHFPGMLGVQHLDMPHLRGREKSVDEAESDERTTGRKTAKKKIS